MGRSGKVLQVVPTVTDRAHCYRSRLTNHGVESKRCHGGDGNTLGTRACVKDFGLFCCQLHVPFESQIFKPHTGMIQESGPQVAEKL